MADSCEKTTNPHSWLSKKGFSQTFNRNEHVTENIMEYNKNKKKHVNFVQFNSREL